MTKPQLFPRHKGYETNSGGNKLPNLGQENDGLLLTIRRRSQPAHWWRASEQGQRRHDQLSGSLKCLDGHLYRRLVSSNGERLAEALSSEARQLDDRKGDRPEADREYHFDQGGSR